MNRKSVFFLGTIVTALLNAHLSFACTQFKGNGGFVSTGDSARVEVDLSSDGSKITVKANGKTLVESVAISPIPTPGGARGVSADGKVKFAIDPDGGGNLWVEMPAPENVLEADYIACKSN